MIILKWAPFPEADIVSYKVYRSMIGTKVIKAAPATLAGKNLLMKLNDGPMQSFVFSGLMSAVDLINLTLVGGRAYNSLADNSIFYIRSDVRGAPGRVEIIGGTALPDLGLIPRLIYEKSEDEVIANPAAGLPDEMVTYEDPDGVLLDFYALSTVNSLSEESIKTAYRRPIQSTGPICVLEGLVTDIQGVRIPDALVTAEAVIYPQKSVANSLTKEPIQTLTGPDGRYSLAVLQKTVIKLEIPDVGFSRFITVPELPYASVTDLLATNDHALLLSREGLD